MAFQRSVFTAGLVVIFGLAVSCSGGGDTSPGLATDGKSIFKRNCALCHGKDGKLMLAGAPDLSKSTMTADDRIQLILNGKGTMTPFKGKLTTEQVRIVSEYLESLQD
jgi:cytochrome c6